MSYECYGCKVKFPTLTGYDQHMKVWHPHAPKDEPTPKCELCHGTGYYGDNGPGLKGNNEYTRCECRSHLDRSIEKEYGDFEQVNGAVVNDLNKQIQTLTEENERLKANSTVFKAENFKLKDQLTAAREALKKYGTHENCCPKDYPPVNHPCDCGYEQALKATENGEK